MTEFQRALAKVLLSEGGWSNNPADPGGATMKGVTQRVYDAYRKIHGLPPQTVKAITNSELETIYKTQYWDQFKGDQMPAGVSYVVFDGAVNSGVAQSVKWLQRALGVTADGIVGVGTLSAINTHVDVGHLIVDMCRQRIAFLKALKTWSTFGRGWQARVNSVCVTGQAWADGAETPMRALEVDNPGIADDATQKAPASAVADAPAKAPGDVVTGVGGASVVLSQAVGQLQQFAFNPTIQQAVMWLTIAGVVLALGGYAYRVWAKRKADKIKAAVA